MSVRSGIPCLKRHNAGKLNILNMWITLDGVQRLFALPAPKHTLYTP